jgi:hypothetical protein
MHQAVCCGYEIELHAVSLWALKIEKKSYRLKSREYGGFIIVQRDSRTKIHRLLKPGGASNYLQEGSRLKCQSLFFVRGQLWRLRINKEQRTSWHSLFHQILTQMTWSKWASLKEMATTRWPEFLFRQTFIWRSVFLTIQTFDCYFLRS